QVEAMYAALIALTEIRVDGPEVTALRRPPRQLRRFSPIFPVSDLAAALAHYAALGFRVDDGGGDAYGFAARDGVELHLHASRCPAPLGATPRPRGRLPCTPATPTRCTRSGASRASAAAPPRSARPATGCARARTPTRTATSSGSAPLFLSGRSRRIRSDRH